MENKVLKSVVDVQELTTSEYEFKNYIMSEFKDMLKKNSGNPEMVDGLLIFDGFQNFMGFASDVKKDIAMLYYITYNCNVFYDDLNNMVNDKVVNESLISRVCDFIIYLIQEAGKEEYFSQYNEYKKSC